jgi:hypothetical protein
LERADEVKVVVVVVAAIVVPPVFLAFPSFVKGFGILVVDVETTPRWWCCWCRDDASSHELEDGSISHDDEDDDGGSRTPLLSLLDCISCRNICFVLMQVADFFEAAAVVVVPVIPEAVGRRFKVGGVGGLGW